MGGRAVHGGRGGRGCGEGRGTGGPPALPDPKMFHAGDARNEAGEFSSHLAERFRGGRQDQFRSLLHTSSLGKQLEVSLNLDIRKYVEEQRKIQSTAEDGDWLALSEVPTNEEVSIGADAEVVLAPNKVTGKWKSKAKYLQAQYKLLREDAISPLREAVDKFRKTPEMKDDHTLSIYEKVHIVGFTFAQLGIAARIRFSTARACRQILWNSSKRLVSGTILALSPTVDNFKEKCIVAVVAARPISGVTAFPPEVDIYFSRTEDIQIDPQDEWIMLEAKSGYYESYRHTLRAIQKLSQESFPMFEYIGRLSQKIEPPSYLAKNPVVNLAAAANDDQKPAFQQIDVIKDWPIVPSNTLDETQWDALQHIITKSFAIVQGPPGCGKTFVSKTALEIIANHSCGIETPIIVAAQTNHALDQLLMHVSAFEPNFIRLGGRSTNPKVKERALFEIRQVDKIPPIPGSFMGKGIHQWKNQSKNLTNILEPLHRTGTEPFSIETFRQYRILTSKQSDSLERGASQWVSSSGEDNSPVRLWLDRALIHFEVVYNTVNFASQEDDDDLEPEQLKELEAETGINDVEDIESLKGAWCSVQQKYTVAHPTATNLDKAKRLLDTVEDLWKVPPALRGPMYLVMQQRLKTAILVAFREEAVVYEQILSQLKVGKWERDAVYLQQAKIIGMTTTGLSKYRPLIASLKPKIILIEEAAEVLEAPITAACIESLQHIILVGDHQQLQGHCADRGLEGEPYFLNVSMFERMVKNDIPFRKLLRQRRMNPEFRKLLSTLYPLLEDHPSVINRPSLSWGMGEVRSFFFTHDWPEYKDSQMSTYNDLESQFIAGFYRYLISNNIPPENITILTFYNGQRKRILKDIKALTKSNPVYNIVKTVDSYQGEENKIVILSLARSNREGNIGFLENSNRVCVALSRAQLGFYIFGDAHMLSRNALWQHVVTSMKGNPLRFGPQLPIQCEKHHRTKMVQWNTEWDQLLGGCGEACGTLLGCGHLCDVKCHNYAHDNVKCNRKCTKPLNCGHECEGKCAERCYCNCGDFMEEKVDEGFDIHNDGPQTSSMAPATSSWTQVASDRHGMPSDVRQSYTAPGERSIDSNDPLSDQPRLAVTSTSNQSSIEGHHISSEKQTEMRQAWAGFANGGAKIDDEARARSAAADSQSEQQPSLAEESVATLLVEFSPEQKIAAPFKSEHSRILSNGRTEYTQEYQLVGARGRGVGASPSTGLGADDESQQVVVENLLN